MEVIGIGVGAERWRVRRKSARGRIGKRFEWWKRVLDYGSRCSRDGRK